MHRNGLLCPPWASAAQRVLSRRPTVRSARPVTSMFQPQMPNCCTSAPLSLLHRPLQMRSNLACFQSAGLHSVRATVADRAQLACYTSAAAVSATATTRSSLSSPLSPRPLSLLVPHTLRTRPLLGVLRRCLVTSSTAHTSTHSDLHDHKRLDYEQSSSSASSSYSSPSSSSGSSSSSVPPSDRPQPAVATWLLSISALVFCDGRLGRPHSSHQVGSVDGGMEASVWPASNER